MLNIFTLLSNRTLIYNQILSMCPINNHLNIIIFLNHFTLFVKKTTVTFVLYIIQVRMQFSAVISIMASLFGSSDVRISIYNRGEVRDIPTNLDIVRNSHRSLYIIYILYSIFVEQLEYECDELRKYGRKTGPLWSATGVIDTRLVIFNCTRVTSEHCEIFVILGYTRWHNQLYFEIETGINLRRILSTASSRCTLTITQTYSINIL